MEKPATLLYEMTVGSMAPVAAETGWRCGLLAHLLEDVNLNKPAK